MQRIELLAFGQTEEILGAQSVTLELKEDLIVDELRAFLEKEYSRLSEINYSVALNQKGVEGSEKIKEGDIVAILPPFAGG
ncbi:MAG TPA: hypothetical protein DDX92_14385 [Flavobacteriales bacterium]|jgi:molybdopterin synthase sulfur carrier subunit|nr:hypothetical protein [Flavobacteriales bacterium]